jgi:hypothetical protein
MNARFNTSDTSIMEIKRISIPLDGTEGSHSLMEVSEVLNP